MLDNPKPMPTVKGRAKGITVLVNADRQAIGLKFDLITENEGLPTSTPIEVMFDTPGGKALLEELQNYQP